jgi:PIN domain nuclease of toxin-antitoxin system
MEFLVDTHTLIWWHTSPEKLSKRTYKFIEDYYNRIFYSPLSFWEISVKYHAGKLSLGQLKPDDFLDCVEQEQAFECLEAFPATLATGYQLPGRHGDPFDRMLVWEAIQHDLILLSVDKTLASYEQDGLRLVT